jgi:opacity protein-like surface antigen
MKLFKGILAFISLLGLALSLNAMEIESKQNGYEGACVGCCKSRVKSKVEENIIDSLNLLNSILSVSLISTITKNNWYIRTHTSLFTKGNDNFSDASLNHEGISVGYRMNNLRGEVEGNYHSQKTIRPLLGINGILTNYNLMFNGYCHFNSIGIINSYVGLGLGLSNTQIVDKLSNSKSKMKGLASQIILGAGYPIADKVDLSLEYRAISQGDLEKKHSSGEKERVYTTKSHLVVALSYNF